MIGFVLFLKKIFGDHVRNENSGKVTKFGYHTITGVDIPETNVVLWVLLTPPVWVGLKSHVIFMPQSHHYRTIVAIRCVINCSVIVRKRGGNAQISEKPTTTHLPRLHVFYVRTVGWFFEAETPNQTQHILGFLSIIPHANYYMQDMSLTQTQYKLIEEY